MRAIVATIDGGGKECDVEVDHAGQVDKVEEERGTPETRARLEIDGHISEQLYLAVCLECEKAGKETRG